MPLCLQLLLGEVLGNFSSVTFIPNKFVSLSVTYFLLQFQIKSNCSNFVTVTLFLPIPDSSGSYLAAAAQRIHPHREAYQVVI